MRKLTLTLLAAVVAGPAAFAGELILGSNGKSDYQIVIPDAYPNDRLKESVAEAAKWLQKAFAENKMDLPIVAEAVMEKNKPTIYLGRAKFAEKNGVDFANMPGWTYAFKVVGKNLIVAGNDQPDPIPLEKRRDREAKRGGIPYLGTLKAVTEFLYKYCGVRFLHPGECGVEFLPTPTIEVPDDLNVVKRPYARNVEISRSDDIFSIANGFEPCPKVISNYGHYHHTAIPPEKYGETNPDYFILVAGERDGKSAHYCFSNPRVRELIYQKILEDCDAGYDLIELGQNDGFRPCQCEECRTLYGFVPKVPPEDILAYQRDPAWGEKLWKMHREMAERLKKDRPDKKLMISAYSVTRDAPTSIKDLPDNAMIEMMKPTPEIFEDWRRIDVPAGYAAYLYLWGTFHVPGYAPLRSRRFIKDKVKTLLDNNINIIQNNGKPFTFGIEGINVYAYRRMMNDPEAKPIEDYYDEYIDAAYREAAGPMRRFYRKLHRRLDFMPEAMEVGYTQNRDPRLTFSMIYTPQLMAELEKLLDNAERMVKTPTAKKRVEITRFEFDYLKRIVDIIHLYNAFLTQKDEASLKRVVDAVEERNQWIDGLRDKWKKKVGYGVTFANRRPDALKKNGRRMWVEPFNWNVEEMRSGDFLKQDEEAKRMTVKKVAGPVSINSDAWKTAPKQKLGKELGAKKVIKDETTFQALYDDENLYVRFDGVMKKEHMNFRSRGRDAEIWLQECVNVCLAPEADKSQYYYLNVDPVENSYTDAAHGFITDTLHPKFGWNDNTWNGDWSYQSELLEDQDKWLIMLTVPFKTLKAATPTPGTIWMGNFGRVHYPVKEIPGGFSAKNAIREKSVWTGRINVSRTPGEGYFGEMVFE